MSETKSQLTVDDIIKKLGITRGKYVAIRTILGRKPQILELRIFSEMWSKYQTSKNFVQRQIEDAESSKSKNTEKDLIKLDEKLAIVSDLKTQSLNNQKIINHGNIISRLIRMAAKPIGILAAVELGALDDAESKKFLQEVIGIINSFGKKLEVPAALSKTERTNFDNAPSFYNIMSIGIVHFNQIPESVARGKGNKVMLILPFENHSDIETETEVENSLLSTSIELTNKVYMIGAQDIDKGGIAYAATEMAFNVNNGIELNLDTIARINNEISPSDALLTSTKGRLLVVIRRGFEREVKEVCKNNKLNCIEIGKVTDTEFLDINFKGKRTASLPIKYLLNREEEFDYEKRQILPQYLNKVRKANLNKLKKIDYNQAVLKLLSSLSISNQDSAIKKLNKQNAHSEIFDFAVNLDGEDKLLVSNLVNNSRYLYLNPYKGGAIAVAKATRRMACTGIKPLGINLSFCVGNYSENEELFLLENSVRGFVNACNTLHIPIIGNELNLIDVDNYYNVTLGAIGLIKGNPKIDFVTPWFKKDSNFIILLGTIKGELGGSQYLKDIHGKVAGDAPNIDLEFESRVIRACLDGIRHRIINSAIDVSDGGLAVAIAKACISNPEIELGASIHISRKLKNEELLFGESQSMIIVTIDEDKLLEIETIASKNLVPCFTIGRVKDNGMMKFNDLINLPLADLKSAYNGK